MSLLCVCTDKLVDVDNNPCGAVNYGNHIVAVFFQKLSGVQFDGTMGNSVSVAADWATKIAATNDNKISKLPNIYAMLTPQEPTVDEEVPGGGIEVIDNKLLIEGKIKYLSQTVFTQIEKKTLCEGSTRMWYLTNTNWLFGSEVQADATLGKGFDGAYFISQFMSLEGVGTRANIPFKIQATNTCQPKPVAQLPFLRAI